MAVDNRTENRNYPLPDKDNKLNEDVLRLIAALQAIDVDIADIIAALATKAAVSHPHVISDITGLQDALNGKAASTHQHALNDLTDVDVSSAANNQVLKRVGTLWFPATLQIGDVSGLQAILDEFQDDLGLTGKATGSDFRGGTDDNKALTTKAAYDASAEVTLTYANPLVINFSQGTNFVVTLLGSPEIRATGLENVSGKMGRIRFIQDTTGNREPTWNSAFVFSGGEAPEFSSSGGAEDRAYYDICDGKVYIAFVEDVK